MLREAADDGRNLIVVSDDAYFGLFYGDDLLQGVALRPPGRLPRAASWRSRWTGRPRKSSSGASAPAC